ncbi:MAG: hypothetical protein KDC84_11160 [Crocinitomicaceae bacterium]|nr:hypothetical protein [Crocinitomicaceae bacterium]
MFFFIIISSYTFAQNCVDTKTGVFSYVTNGMKVFIVRYENEQIEFFNKGDSKLLESVKWTSDSTYILTHIIDKNVNGSLKKGDKIFSTVVSCKDSTVIVDSYLLKKDAKESDKISIGKNVITRMMLFRDEDIPIMLEKFKKSMLPLPKDNEKD